MTPRRLAPAPVRSTARSAHRAPFAPTFRAAALLAAGLLWLAPAWIDPRALLLMGVWNALVVGAIAVDATRLPRPAALTLTRRWHGPLTLGEPVSVSVDVANAGGIPIVARVTDYLDPALVRDPVRLHGLHAGPGRTVTAGYDVSPRERGDRAAGTAVVEWRSAWGLVDRWAEAPLAQSVRVYPNLHEARRHSMYLIRSRQIALERRRAKRAAHGREFDRLRDYRPGDDRRDVSWIASARRARLVTKLYQPERSQTLWLLVDAGRLLRARTGGQTLLDRSATAALALAQVAMVSGDNVGLIAYGRRIQHRLAPARGAAHLRRLIDALAVTRAEAVEANHGAAAAALSGRHKRRALVVWLTEVAETAGVPDVIEQAIGLTSRHVVLFVAIRQPDVAALAAMRPGTANDMFRMLAAQEAMERREALLRRVRQRGALIVEATPEELSGGLVDRYLEIKERGLI